MNKVEVRLTHENARQTAINAVNAAELNKDKPLVMKISVETRSMEQNRKIWAVIGDIQKQVVWGGKLRDGETWKNLIAFQALKEIAEEDGKSFNGDFLPTLDRQNVISSYISTRSMNKDVFARLITVAERFGAEEGVKFSDEAKRVIEWGQWYDYELTKARADKRTGDRKCQ